jgi:RNA recognition motif. (a.k.a. RRM, RBD, or RNP domain)
MVDHSTGRSRGFGFVTFDSEEAVDNVMSDGNMHDIGGKQVSLSFFLMTPLASILLAHSHRLLFLFLNNPSF